jgi:hypothetical protein
MNVRAYTLTVHAGHAPCWMPDMQQGREVLSLANCKPPIRTAAPVGEWIAGITPKGTGCRLAYFMQVGERLTRQEQALRQFFCSTRADAAESAMSPSQCTERLAVLGDFELHRRFVSRPQM